jgi:cation diffusion facilitator CzcD-associated flavoprotein CzcO
MTRDPKVIVVGAGPAGLAVSACLRREGVAHELLERAASVASSWRGHYERLCLHTAKEHSALPGLPFPDDYPTYPARAQVIEYLERYAEVMGVSARLGVEVTRAAREGARWRVWAADGLVGESRALVVATGYNAVPERASWPGLETFAGPLVHSSDYKNGAGLANRRVLVVGSGNSGAEIAVDLWECGAQVAMVVRGPVHVVPRDAFGIPAQRIAVALGRLPAAVADRLSLPLRDATIGDLSAFGIHRPELGPLELLEKTGRVPLIDIGTVALIRQGAISVYPNIARVAGEVVHFVDGRSQPFDAMVLATGYRAGLARWLEGADGVLDARGLPRLHGCQALPGLYFCGFRNPTTGALREIAIEAERIAGSIAGRPARARWSLPFLAGRRRAGASGADA